MNIRGLLRTVVWMLPASRTKNSLLRRLGHNIHPSARVAPNVVLHVKHFEVAAGGRVAPFNLIKHMTSISVSTGAHIGKMNVISAHPVYARLYEDGARLALDDNSYITSRHTLDCSGGMSVGELAAVAGRQTLVLTHSIDLGRDSQLAYPVVVGERSFVGARCVLLGGAVLPSRSVLAAGSVLTRNSSEQQSGVWAGAPATYRGAKEGRWFDRESMSTRRVYVPATGTMVEDAF